MDLAIERRKQNARKLSFALTLLGLVGVLTGPLAGAPTLTNLATLGQTVLCLIAYLLLRRDYFLPGVILMMLGPLGQHVATVASLQKLTVLPFVSSLAVLLAAATLPLRQLYVGVLLTVLAIVAQVALVDLTAYESVRASGLLVGALLFLGAVVVISFLHVHGTERAMSLARDREQAREAAAAAAQASEHRYRLIAEHSIDLIALLDMQGRSTYLSPSHERVLGFATDEALGKSFLDLVGSDYRKAAEQCLAEVSAAGRSRGELVLEAKNRTELLFDSTFTCVQTDAGDFVAVMSRNITEKRALEENLRRASRMEALGRMARGIAHDFNNLLAALLGNAELAESELPANHPARADLESIREAAKSATRLTQQLLVFSRSQARSPAKIEPAVELANLAPLLAGVAGKNVNLVIESDKSCPAVYLHGAHFEQLLLNLTGNAAHAMSTGGVLRIRLNARKLAQGELADLRAGEYVELCVEDNGVGIAADVLPHLFEPFYTTRGESGGTGLGLATCYGIAIHHGGQILVESEPGKGTTFRVLLPAVSLSNETSALRPLLPARPRGTGPIPSLRSSAGRSILLVDDEPAVREVARRMLVAAGNQVHDLGTYADAKSAIEDLGRHYDVVLTDIVLAPGLGTDLLELARTTRPKARLCAISGFLPSREVESALRRTGAVFVSKPFDRATLLAAVNGELTPSTGTTTL